MYARMMGRGKKAFIVAEPLRSQKLNMTEGPILGKLIRFTLPVMASGVLQLLFNAADVAVVGKFAGEAAMAAVGSCGALINLIVNLFIGSASAKWAILAPVFVPMMMLMGYDPALTQIVYRIGDSLTNPLSPLFTYMPVAIGFVRKYNKDAGIGTVIANMIPYSATFAVAWLIQLILWVTLNLPLGPGGGIYL